MARLNQIILIGNLTRDPELRYTPEGTPVASFTVAVNRSFVNREGEREADFIPIVVWRKRAETCAEYLMKGRWVTEVVAQRVEFLQRLKRQPSPEVHEEKVENEIDKVPSPELEEPSSKPEEKDDIPFGE